jgi:NTE family protein
VNVVSKRRGLVLAGGGARGAYQVGALRYLAETGWTPDLVAGTSIGALNGAALAAAPSFSRGVEQLTASWQRLGRSRILRPNTSGIAMAGTYAGLALAPGLSKWMRSAWAQLMGQEDRGAIFDPAPIIELLEELAPPADVRRGLPLWAAVCRTLDVPWLPGGGLKDLLVAAACADVEWVHVNAIADDEQLREVLLASAAIPLAFPRRRLRGVPYVDGGLRDNVPLGALAAQGCTEAIVIHLGNGVTWDRSDFPSVGVIEIRPRLPIQEDDTSAIGWVRSLLDFSIERIEELIRRGYADAQACVEEVGAVLRSTHEARREHARLMESTRQLLEEPPIRPLASRFRKVEE